MTYCKQHNVCYAPKFAKPAKQKLTNLSETPLLTLRTIPSPASRPGTTHVRA